jgi:tRNA U55 pseudouridine synthase TruB
MSSLERTAIGDFTVESAIDLNDLTENSLTKHLLPAVFAVRHINSLVLTNAEIHQISNGLTIERPHHGFNGDIAAFDTAGHLVAIVAPRSPDQLRPISNLAIAAAHAANQTS